MILVIGEILYDVFPDARRIGGAPFNFAFHMMRMGFAVRFVTRVGADEDGAGLLDFMQRSGFDPGPVQKDKAHQTGKVMVYPDPSGGHRFDILQDVAYDYIDGDEATLQLSGTPPELIYFGTLAQRSPQSRRAIRRICHSRPTGSIVFYDVNLRPGCYSRDIVEQSLAHADILKLNDEELVELADMFHLTGAPASIVGRLMRDHRLKLVALSKGGDGSEIFSVDDHVAMPLRQSYECVDTVGAGDAFAAVLAAGYVKKRSVQQILPAASDFAGRICGIPGAIPEDPDFYKPVTF